MSSPGDASISSSPRARRPSSFQTRALAVRAAHRFTHGGSAGGGSDLALSPGSSLPPSPHPISPFIPPNGSHIDLEAGALPSPLATPLSEHGTGGIGSNARKVHFSPEFTSHGPSSRRSSHSSRRLLDVEEDEEEGIISPGSTTSRIHSTRARYKWLSPGRGGATGDEPGVDVRSKRDEEGYGHLKGRTGVTVVDYSSDPHAEDSNLVADFPGDRLKEWLETDGKDRPLDDDGKPIGVRWIHVNGLNWEVIKTLTLQYGLHPLAVEDALRSHNSPRSKLDFYKSHLYLQILVQHLHREDAEYLESEVDVDVDEPFPGLDRREGDEADMEVEHMHGNLGIGPDAVPSVGAGNAGLRRRSRKSKRPSGGLQRLKDMFGGSRRIMLPEGVEGVFEPSMQFARGRQTPYQKEAHRITVNTLSAKYMVPVRRGLMSMFMTRDGTIITLMRRPIREMLRPIYARLEDEQSLLRRSGDPSMLVQALLDISADLAVETFESEILRLEASVLVDPKMETVRHLHVLSSQLIRLRRAITPLLHITSNIRDQDVQRSAAASAIRSKEDDKKGNTGLGVNAANMMIPTINLPAPQRSASGAAATPGWATPRDEPGSIRSSFPPVQGVSQRLAGIAAAQSGNHGQNGMNGQDGRGGQMTTNAGQMAMPMQGGVGMGEGYMSPMTRIYIGDVLDHLEMVVSSLDQFVATCDHLTDYVFNVLSFQMNVSMERLSIVTVIFLPLTFISSYYGMNFEEFPDIIGSVTYFWKIAIPCTSAFFIIFSYSYIFTFFETVRRKLASWRRKRELEERYHYRSEK